MPLIMIFFFKQKTAYEMRISDWSSDVCSSDLVLGVTIKSRGENMTKAESTKVLVVEDDEDLNKAYRIIIESAGYEVTSAHDGKQALGLIEIGRASCRERVCQYV